ncbi:MAG: sulfatase-like hydrolase/transferase, partial [Planctomycetes bacterium]|nr:sulfatase-like hydrolase/transferase [Planctomycetota bacterium]
MGVGITRAFRPEAALGSGSQTGWSILDNNGAREMSTMRKSMRLTRLLAGWFLSVVCLLGWGGSRACGGETSQRPNLVIVLVDDLRWDEIGCAGHPFVKTPEVDRVAREGARFLSAFATTPLCSPVRGSLLTGLYAHAHGIVDNTDRSERSHQLQTFPRVLQREGYETAYIGKWHMGNDPTPRPGFDYWVSIKGQGETTDPEIYENGKLARVPGYITDIFTDRAVEFIRRERSKPFLLYLSHKAIHPNLTQYDDGSISDPSAAVFIPAERHKDLYADATVTRRPNAADPLEGKPALRRKIGDLPPLSPETGTSDTTILNRLRMLAAVDEGLGRMVKALEEGGQLDNTVLVFTSDHGYFNGEHGLSVERRLAY